MRKNCSDPIMIKFLRDECVEFEVRHNNFHKCLQLLMEDIYQKYGVKYILIIDERKNEDDN